MTPKKLIRGKIIDRLLESEWEHITDHNELIRLYELKILEELDEIRNSGHKDVFEFADLMHAVTQYARICNFDLDRLYAAMADKKGKNGILTDIALNNLNPNNPSNRVYFEPSKTGT